MCKSIPYPKFDTLTVTSLVDNNCKNSFNDLHNALGDGNPFILIVYFLSWMMHPGSTLIHPSGFSFSPIVSLFFMQ